MGKIQPVILAGGTGSRLWPLSRELYPKQLLRLTSNTSLLQATLLRIKDLPEIMPPVIVVGEKHRFITKNQVEELECFDNYSILLEPVGKNTAPAICGAAEFCRQQGEDVVLLILPADHVVMYPEKFTEAVRQAVELAAEGAVVTFGIQPTGPEIGYGYIEQGEGNRVASFKEKPDLAVAMDYLAKGNYFWNSGMFAFTVGTFMREMEKHAPEMLACMVESVVNGTEDGRFFRFEKSAMVRCPSDSIDYALMEKTAIASVVVC